MALIGVQPVQNASLQPGHYKPAEKKTDMDKILEGLQIAGSIGGLAVDYQKFNNYAKQNSALDDTQNGVLTQKEILDAQTKGLRPALPGEQGAMPYRTRTGPDDEDIVDSPLILSAKPKSPVYEHVTNATKNGQTGTSIFDMSSGKPVEAGFIPTAKPEGPPKDQRLMTVQDTDENGNPVVKVVPMVAGAEYATTKGVKPEGPTDKKTTARFDNLTNYLTGGRSAPQDIKQESAKLRTAAHGLSLLNGGSLDKLNEMSPVEMQELSGVLAGQVAQGSPAQATLQHMTPETAAKSLAEAYQYITGKPADANQGEFAQLFGKMLDRQVQTSQNILADKFGTGIANALDLRDEDPAKFDRIMKASGITLDKDGNVLAYNPSFLSKAKAGKPEGPAKGGAGMAVAAPSPGGDGKPQLAPTQSGYMPGSVLDIDGVHYRVSDDGRRAVPVGGK